MDVHKKCLQTWGTNNYQTLKRKVHLFGYGRKVISSCTKTWSKEMWAPLKLRNILFQNGFIKIQNLEHIYGATKTQLPRKADGAQSSIDKRPIPPKNIGCQAWCPIKGPWIHSHNPGPIMSPHTYITFLSKFTKRDRKEGGIVWMR
jgi:hypothetical protein